MTQPDLGFSIDRADGSPPQDGDVYVIRNGQLVAVGIHSAAPAYTAEQIKAVILQFDTAAGLERLEVAKKMASMLAGFAREQDPNISLPMARG